MSSAQKKANAINPTWPPIDERGWWSQVILLSVRETELEEMNCHERGQHQTSDSQIQLSALQFRRQLLPRSLQTNKDAQQSAQQHLLFDDVFLETQSCPIHANVEIAVLGEVVLISDGRGTTMRKIKKTALRVSPVRSLKDGSPDLVK